MRIRSMRPRKHTLQYHSRTHSIFFIFPSFASWHRDAVTTPQASPFLGVKILLFQLRNSISIIVNSWLHIFYCFNNTHNSLNFIANKSFFFSYECYETNSHGTIKVLSTNYVLVYLKYYLIFIMCIYSWYQY